MGNETVAVYNPHLADSIPAWVVENIQAVNAYMRYHGHEEWTIAGVRSPAAHAREVEAKDAYIREADRRISKLASLLNQANVDRLREVEDLRRRAEAAESDARSDGEIVPSGCGVEARIHFEDPRYPTLVLDGDEFGTIGYDLRRDTGELRRVCICHAHCEHECVCGYDAAIASGGEDRK